MSELIISVSGLRGIVGETLTAEVAARYAAAFAALPPRGRSSSAATAALRARCLADAIHARLNALGRGTIEAGILPTPSTGVLLRACRAGGGIQITASHNPSPYNGMKLFSARRPRDSGGAGRKGAGAVSERRDSRDCRTAFPGRQ